MNIRLCDVLKHRWLLFWIPAEKLKSVSPKLANTVVAYDSEVKRLKQIKEQFIKIFRERISMLGEFVHTSISCDIERYIVNDIDYKDWEVRYYEEGKMVRRKAWEEGRWLYEEDEEYHAVIINFASDFLEDWKIKNPVEVLSLEAFRAAHDTIIEELSTVGVSNDEVHNLYDEASEIIKRIHKRINILLEVENKYLELKEASHEIARLFHECEDPLVEQFICDIEKRIEKIFEEKEEEDENEQPS